MFGFGPDVETKFSFRIDGLDCPNRIDWTCVGGPPEWQPTSIVWTFEPTEGGTKVGFEHRNWASAQGELAACTLTWARILTALEKYVTTGSATPTFTVY
jgi:Activator of Hsp90 ATPase homolog 1-like protein